MADLPPEALEDYFRPPLVPTEVGCMDCGEVYWSDQIVWRGGFWRCPTPGCSGAGFGFEILPLDPEFVDPEGRSMPKPESWFDEEDEGDGYLDDEEDDGLLRDEDEDDVDPALIDLLREREARQRGLWDR